MQQTHSEEDSQKSKGGSGDWSPRYLIFCLFRERRRTCVWCFQRSSMNSVAPFPNHPLSLDSVFFFFFKVVCLLTCVQCLPTRLYSIIFSVQPPASFRCVFFEQLLFGVYVYALSLLEVNISPLPPLWSSTLLSLQAHRSTEKQRTFCISLVLRTCSVPSLKKTCL